MTTKVSKSLVYDLYEYQKRRSPQKTCHKIARLMNREEDSPLYRRIKLLGRATGEPMEFITQATFVTRLMRYISDDPMKDRDTLRRGKKPEPATDRAASKLLFRDLFLAEKDAEIARIVWNYFDAVAERWTDAWESTEKGDMLNRTQGFGALMRFLAPVYRAKRDKQGRLARAAVLSVLKGIELRDTAFTTDNYPPGGTGEGKLYRELRELSSIE